MSEFKVGDRVKVLRAFTEEEAPNLGWNVYMNDWVGKEVTIEEIDADGDIYASSPEHWARWYFPPCVLEKVED